MTTALESRVRRMADRQGLRLVKSRSRNPEALDHGLCMLVDVETGGAIFGSGPFGCDATIEEAEEHLEGLRTSISDAPS